MRPVTKVLAPFTLIASVTLMLLSCKGTTPPVRFYTLTPLPESRNVDPMADVQIGIGPLKFPALLDRPQIVTRPAPGRLELAEFQRWGGKFKDDFLSVLASNISILLGTDQVFVYPWLDKLNPAYRIDIEVYRFDGKLGDSVTLHAGWILRTHNQKNQVRLKRSMISEPVTGNEFDALISAKSRAVEKFSVLIVEELKQHLKLSADNFNK